MSDFQVLLDPGRFGETFTINKEQYKPERKLHNSQLMYRSLMIKDEDPNKFLVISQLKKYSKHKRNPHI